MGTGQEEPPSRPTLHSHLSGPLVHDSFVSIVGLSTSPLTVVLPRRPTMCIPKSRIGQILQRKECGGQLANNNALSRTCCSSGDVQLRFFHGCNGLTLAQARLNDSLTPRARLHPINIYFFLLRSMALHPGSSPDCASRARMAFLLKASFRL
jgi:hypothetical protein